MSTEVSCSCFYLLLCLFPVVRQICLFCSGKFGLWLDGDLYQGRTQRCNTYGNEPLAPQEDFVVKTMECWAFI